MPAPQWMSGCLIRPLIGPESYDLGLVTRSVRVVSRSARTVTGPQCIRRFRVIRRWHNPAMAPFVIESCHSTWVVDLEHSRFKRILKAADASALATTAWRECYGLEI